MLFTNTKVRPRPPKGLGLHSTSRVREFFRPGARMAVPFLEAKFGECRDVVGRGPDGLALYCGKPAKPGTSWCPKHARKYLSGRPLTPFERMLAEQKYRAKESAS